MATPAILDIPALLQPISEATPAGAYPVPFESRQKLEQARTEVTADPDDPLSPEAKSADWPTAAQVAQEILAKESKDLRTAACLTEALVRQHGFVGLRDGLRLLRELIERCWDRLNPPVEDGDLEVRAGPFYWLDDPEKGARFPTVLRTVPLVSGTGRAYGWLHWRQSQEGRGDVTHDDFDKALQATSLEYSEKVTGELNESLDELSQLGRSLSEKMGTQAPAMTGLRTALEECRALAMDILRRKRLEAGGAEADGGELGTTAEGSAGPSGALRTREQAYRQIAQAADLLRRLEPHSPVPYLIRRAVDLGGMSFPDLIKTLIRDANVLTELNRELGIKVEEPKESAPE
jgi:type VI secretion system protein ImpA